MESNYILVFSLLIMAMIFGVVAIALYMPSTETSPSQPSNSFNQVDGGWQIAPGWQGVPTPTP